jgi:hypothetical protein
MSFAEILLEERYIQKKKKEEKGELPPRLYTITAKTKSHWVNYVAFRECT